MNSRIAGSLPATQTSDHRTDVDGPITYELMAQDTIAFLAQVVGGPAYLLGHSVGAPLGLIVALLRPGADPHRRRPRRLPRPGARDGRRPRRRDPHRDTLALYRGLRNAQLAVLPGTGHGGIDIRVVIRFLTAIEDEG